MDEHLAEIAAGLFHHLERRQPVRLLGVGISSLWWDTEQACSNVFDQFNDTFLMPQPLVLQQRNLGVTLRHLSEVTDKLKDKFCADAAVR